MTPDTSTDKANPPDQTPAQTPDQTSAQPPDQTQDQTPDQTPDPTPARSAPATMPSVAVPSVAVPSVSSGTGSLPGLATVPDSRAIPRHDAEAINRSLAALASGEAHLR